jgi:hypothetical protein
MNRSGTEMVKTPLGREVEDVRPFRERRDRGDVETERTVSSANKALNGWNAPSTKD